MWSRLCCCLVSCSSCCMSLSGSKHRLSWAYFPVLQFCWCILRTLFLCSMLLPSVRCLVVSHQLWGEILIYNGTWDLVIRERMMVCGRDSCFKKSQINIFVIWLGRCHGNVDWCYGCTGGQMCKCILNQGRWTIGSKRKLWWRNQGRMTRSCSLIQYVMLMAPTLVNVIITSRIINLLIGLDWELRISLLGKH